MKPRWIQPHHLLPLLFGAVFSVFAHPADMSELQVTVDRQRIDFRFTFNLPILQRISPLDRNADGSVDNTELEAAGPLLIEQFNRHAVLKINGQPLSWSQVIVSPVWPKQNSAPLTDVDRCVDLQFVQNSPEVIANFALDFTLFPLMGEGSEIEGHYIQGEHRLHVPFSANQPDYLYDTGFAVEHLFQSPVAKPAPDARWGALPLLGLSLLSGILVVLIVSRWQQRHGAP